MDTIEGLDVFSLDSLGDKHTDLRDSLQAALEKGRDFETRTFQLDSSEGQKTYTIQGSIVGREEEKRPYRILLHFKASSR